MEQTENQLQEQQEKKRLDADLWIIALVTLAVFLLYGMIGSGVTAFCKDSEVSVWPRLFAAAALEYGMAGLGITIVCLLRKESFVSFGLRKENAAPAIAFTILCYVPYIIVRIASGACEVYEPLSILVTPDLHRAGILATILGTIVVGIVWGFFEGFNYAVICEKVNRRYPVKSRFFDWGALVCTLMCILFHPMSFDPWGIAELLTTAIAIYGMLQVRKAYGNSWGCVVAFLLIWNAV